jgi:hypothetical protein
MQELAMVGGMFVLDYAVWKHMWESRRKRVKDGVQLAMSHEGRRWNECTRPSPIYQSATPQPALALAARHHSRGRRQSGPLRTLAAGWECACEGACR